MATSTAPRRDVEFSVAAKPSAPAVQAPPRTVGMRHFFRHFGEMFLAMMVGMCGLGALEGMILSAAGTSVSQVRNSAPEVFALVMALNMTAGMTLWMRYRRHSWAMCAEMAGAMFLPAIAAVVLFWCDVIHSPSVGGVEMAVMLPAMLAVMLYRRTEYSQPVRAHRRIVLGSRPG